MRDYYINPIFIDGIKHLNQIFVYMHANSFFLNL
jgi:hypothetical protein